MNEKPPQPGIVWPESEDFQMPVDYSGFGRLHIDRSEAGIATVTMRGAADERVPTDVLLKEFTRFFTLVRDDRETRAIVLTGEGDRFTPVGDLAPLLEKTEESKRTGDWYARLPEHRVPRFVRSLLAVEQPVLAAVNGDALGWGTALASWVDVAIVAEDARFGDIHIELGLSVPQLSLSWPASVGVARAKGLLLTGAVVQGSEAAQMGLVWQAVDRASVLESTMAIARRLASQPPLALQWTKRVLNLGLREQAGVPMDLSMALEGLTLLSQDHLDELRRRLPGPSGG